MRKSVLGQILLNVASFPSLPDAVFKILKLLEKDDVNINEIEKIMRYEPGLTANVLKLANSPFFGVPQQVGSLNQAVIMIGFKRLANLVISVCASELMKKGLDGYNMPPGGLWRHSIAVSHIAEAIAKYKKIDELGDIFTAALLHDLGKLALSNFVKKEFETIKTITSKGVPFEVAENMVLGTDHAEIGSQILRQWNFPPTIVDIVRFHHNPDRINNQNPHVDVLYLSNLLYNSDGDNNIYTGEMKRSYQGVLERLSLKPDELQLISDRTTKITKKLSETKF